MAENADSGRLVRRKMDGDRIGAIAMANLDEYWKSLGIRGDRGDRDVR